MGKDLDLEKEIRVELDIADDEVASLVDRRADLIKREGRAEGFGDVADGHRTARAVRVSRLRWPSSPLPDRLPDPGRPPRRALYGRRAGRLPGPRAVELLGFAAVGLFETHVIPPTS